MLDKPNFHRLLELYQHSIAAFGHVSLFQELVFETAHQPLKRSVSRGNHRHAEASDVESAWATTGKQELVCCTRDCEPEKQKNE